MNVVLLVIDSLRAAALTGGPGDPDTPFLAGLERECVTFRRAYASECWTLPTHCSMFTGLMPSEHGAHFQHLGYHGARPTAAEILAQAGFHTEVITRNFVFDGTIPGITRGFRRRTQVLAESGALNPWTLFLALAKPRFRRVVRSTGFFHPFQRESREFLATFARALMPADARALDVVADRMRTLRRRRTPFFLFCNLYDVHAPYPPRPHSILRPFGSVAGWRENLSFPYFMAQLGAHAYLRPGFRLSDANRAMLLGRYHAAIELMDRKLSRFWTALRDERLLDDTLVILTSDHGEAFGEHQLYLHDASVYDTHLHVPLWVAHPGASPGPVDDVVSTRDLFGLLVAAGSGNPRTATLLDPDYRAARPVAAAEHFHYPHAAGAAPRYRRNLRAAIVGTRKFIATAEDVVEYDLLRDPQEIAPEPSSLERFRAACRHAGAPDAAEQLRMAAA